MEFKSALAALVMVSSTSVFADETAQYLSCSAHFEARARWGETIGSDSGYVDGMERRAELLIDAYEAATPTRTGSSGVLHAEPFYREGSRAARDAARDHMIEDNMIYFAELAPMSGQAPLCAEDAICQVCSDVLRSSME